MQLKKIKQSPSKKVNMLWLLVGLSLMAAGLYIYHYTPHASAYAYVKAYNKKDFEKAFLYYHKETMKEITNKFSKDEMIELLRQEAQKKEKITPEELTMIKDQKTHRWFVKFPYSLQSIYIWAPTGSNIYLNNKPIIKGNLGNIVEVKDLLPGKHRVMIEYYNHMYPTFKKEINLPEEQEVKSPYLTQDIGVFSPVGTWVKMGGVIKQNQGEKLLFENMIPGQYDLSVFMEDQEIEVFSKKVQIDNKYTELQIDNIQGNEKVKQDLSNFFEAFNRDYKQGIIDHEASFLHKFLTDQVNEEVISDFKMWYIDHKDVKDAKSLMQVRYVYPLSGNQLKTSVLEIVYLTNIEKDDADNLVDKEYRVVIEWNYKLLRSKGTWKIIERKINQSIVAYKDAQGNWIKY